MQDTDTALSQVLATLNENRPGLQINYDMRIYPISGEGELAEPVDTDVMVSGFFNNPQNLLELVGLHLSIYTNGNTEGYWASATLAPDGSNRIEYYADTIGTGLEEEIVGDEAREVFHGLLVGMVTEFMPYISDFETLDF